MPSEDFREGENAASGDAPGRPWSAAKGLLLAFSYVATGKLGLLLALPPGYASAIFPPAGIAIAAALVGGRAVLPWVFLGSLLLNLWVGFEAAQHFTLIGIAAAALIAAASTLQAALGGWALNRAVGHPAPLASGRHILRFLLLAPLICLASATLSVGGLYAFGIVGGADFAANWFNWWIGDSLGLLVVLPLALVAFGEPRALWRGRRLSVALPVVACFGLLVVIFVKASHWEQEHSLTEFRGLSEQAADQLRLRFDEQESLLENLDGLMVHDADGRITRQEFHRFVQNSLARFATLQAIEWAPAVGQAERAGFERAQRADLPGFEIRERDAALQLRRADARPAYFPVTYVEPLAGNEPAVGFDLAFLPDRQRALDKAAADGRAVATAPIRLVQEREDQAGVLLLRAVKESGRLRGFVLTVLRMGDFTGRALAPHRAMLMGRLVDVDAGQALYDGFAGPDAAPLHSRELIFGARHYRLETAPTAAYLAAHKGWESWSVLAVGLLGTGLLSALLLLVTGYAASGEALVRERTGELQESETRLQELAATLGEGVYMFDEAGTIIFANPEAHRLLGWAAGELVGRSCVSLCKMPGDRPCLDEQCDIVGVMRRGRNFRSDRVTYWRKDRSWLPVEVCASPLRRHGRVVGAVVAFSDVSERLRRDEALRSQRDFLSTILETEPECVKVIGPGGKLLQMNKAGLDMLEVASVAEADAYGLINFLLPEHRAAFLELDRQAFRGDSGSLEFQIEGKGGSRRWLESRVAPLRDADGKITSLVSVSRDVTRRREAEQRLSLALRGADLALCDWHIPSGTVVFGDGWSKLLGYPPAELAPEAATLAALMHPDDAAAARAALIRHLKGEAPSLEAEVRLRHKDGHWVWLHARGMAVERSPDGRALRVAGTAMDIGERKRAEENRRLAASVFSHANEGIMICDGRGVIIEVNPAFAEITGYRRDEAVGQTPRLLKSGRHPPEFYRALWRLLLGEGYWEGEIWNQRKDGEPFAARLVISAVRDDTGHVTHYIGTFADITLLKRQQEQLQRLAHYDALTGLPNRVLLRDRMDQALAQARRAGTRLAVCYLDLDGFKPINDELGHEAGDQLLVEVARRLKEALRAVDTVARLGGDEFVLLLTGIEEVGQCRRTVGRVLDAVSRPVKVKDREARVSASVGVTLFPDDGSDADTLLRHADQAMYQAKEGGRNRYHLYDPRHDEEARAQRQALDRIGRALDDDELCLYYQPKVDMRRGLVLGFEALLRWRHPERGLLPPGEILPAVEGSELEVAVGRWVLAAGLRQLAAWHREGRAYTLNVNISAGHLLAPAFVDELGQLLAAHPEVVPEELSIEVHESVALADLDAVSAVFRGCRQLGVKIALDGFGTAYSNLSYFHRLQVDTLNIDRGFVSAMLEDANDLAVVEGAIGLTQAFNRKLVAEGVETPELGMLLLNMGCDVGQGFGIGGPMPACDVAPWVAAFQPDPAWIGNAARLPHDDLPLLVAEIDHRAWIDSLGAWLEADPHGSPPPPLDARHCRFGRWYAGPGASRYGHLAAFRAIGEIHAAVHALGREMADLHYDGKGEAACLMRHELSALRDRLIEQLHALQAELAAAAPAKPTVGS